MIKFYRKGAVVKFKVAAKPMATFKQRIRQLTRLRELLAMGASVDVAGLSDLNFSSRPVRTRMPGAVAGVQSIMTAPYADLAQWQSLNRRQ